MKNKSVANDLKWSKTWNKAINYFCIMAPPPLHMGYCHIWHGKILKSQWCKMITSYLLIPSTNYQGKVLSLSPSGLLLFNSVKCDSNRNSHCMNWILVINNIIYGRRGEGLIPKLILTNMGGNVGGGGPNAGFPILGQTDKALQTWFEDQLQTR